MDSVRKLLDTLRYFAIHHWVLHWRSIIRIQHGLWEINQKYEYYSPYLTSSKLKWFNLRITDSVQTTQGYRSAHNLIRRVWTKLPKHLGASPNLFHFNHRSYACEILWRHVINIPTKCVWDNFHVSNYEPGDGYEIWSYILKNDYIWNIWADYVVEIMHRNITKLYNGSLKILASLTIYTELFKGK
jgi:hypothetical protein